MYQLFPAGSIALFMGKVLCDAVQYPCIVLGHEKVYTNKNKDITGMIIQHNMVITYTRNPYIIVFTATRV